MVSWIDVLEPVCDSRTGTYALYNTRTLSFYAVDRLTYLFVRMAKQATATEAAAALGATSDDVESLRSMVTEEVNSVCAGRAGRGLWKLTLILTNSCNLRCTYCYASGGSYRQPTQTMEVRDAIDALDQVIESSGPIGGVQLFGGEPMLNPEVMHAVLARCKNKGIPVGLVTNGTVHNPAIIHQMADMGGSVTVSIDGPAIIHDRLRRDHAEYGSFDTAMGFFHSCREAGLRVGVEATFTPLHLAKGYGIPELMDFFHAECGISDPHIVPVSGAGVCGCDWSGMESELAETYAHGVRVCLDDLANRPYEQCRGFTLVWGTIQRLAAQRGNSSICPVSDTLVVDSWGSVYPCFMFVGQDDWRLGTIREVGTDQFRDKLGTVLQRNDKGSRSECRRCWAQAACSGCLAECERSCDGGGHAPLCAVQHAVLRQTIAGLASASQDPEKWRSLTGKLVGRKTECA